MALSIGLDYANCLSDRVGSHGIDSKEIDRAQDRMAELTRSLESTRGRGWERWRTLPFEPMRSEHVGAVSRIVKDERERCENLIVLGIGGSALGNIALQSALNPLTWNLLSRDKRNGPRLFVLDNIDPRFVGDVLDFVRNDDPRFERTIVNVISKSGETAETAAQFMIARAMLKDALGSRYHERIIAITDPKKGTMRAICDREGYRTLPVPEGVGGRFSVLSPVGLFSAAMCGIDIEGLLDGASAMDTRCRHESLRENPAAMLAFLLLSFAERGKKSHVLMPYSNALYSLADWFRQLWAESLGKRFDRDGKEVFAGATPIKALGTTDQHSQVQLYREGPNDKVIGFVDVGNTGGDTPPSQGGARGGSSDSSHRKSHPPPDPLPHRDGDVITPAGLGVKNLEYLEGRTLGELIHAEKRATEYALVESQRPNFTITLPTLKAYHVGGFIQLWQVATAYAGLILNIDAYDQPAVETGKVATFGLMGRPGYEEWKQKVDVAMKQTTRRM
jgi:glucose-6-phosphate isomerase